MTWQEILNMITGGNKPSQLSQLASQATSSAPSPASAYDFNTPVAASSATIAPKSATTSSNPTAPITTPNPLPKAGGNGAGGGSGSNPSAATPAGTGDNSFERIIAEQRALAKSAYDEGLRRASAAFDQARGVYEQGKSLLNTRKQEFQKNYDTGNNDILTSYEGERGNTQAAAQGASDRSQAILRSMGLGGSALVKSTLKNTQNNAKALGQLNTSKSTNENANLGAFNENNLWASGQESALQNALQQAQEARTAAENQSGLIYGGDVSGINSNMASYLQNILNNTMAINAANATSGAKVANPYAVNIDNVAASLNAGLGGGNQAATTAGGGASNLVADNSVQAILKRLGLA